MSNIDKHALREAAEKAGSDEWFAFIDTKSKTYSVHTPGDNRCGDVVKWAGFDGQKRAADKARFIAAANPATVLALLDELEAAENRIAELETREINMPPYSFFDFKQGSPLKSGAYCHIDSVNKELAKHGIKMTAAAGKGE
ncbi:TPA: ead/Ea22-like family protein [Escherichia coli]|nr:ead/Ea22-like family protein [Escherichia coli]RWT28524.1 hypothetical protein DN460_11150 [Enterobacter cloacae]HDI5943975.1 ead/Ea22-like family protein [Escherichia coli]HDI5996738.1 ead/Ea22-like family protein [Escherichia coli]HDI6282649.1 ead/Ea22-like family protein [Escherichia coli]